MRSKRGWRRWTRQRAGLDRGEADPRVPLVHHSASRGDRSDMDLALGPALRIAEAADGPDVPRGMAKPNGPPAVSVSATPLEQGRMRVAIEYLPEGATRLRTITCEGSTADIDGEVDKLPELERGQARVALKRIRDLISDKPTSKRWN